MVPPAYFAPVDAGQVHRHRIDRSTIPFCLTVNHRGAIAWEGVMCTAPCTEPSLDELFGDSAMCILMRRDGVAESNVRALLCALKITRAVGSCGTERRLGAGKAQPMCAIQAGQQITGSGQSLLRFR
jgi:hypothetical protein